MTQHQNKDRGWWKGLWDLPRIEAPTPSALRNQLQPLSKNLHPLGIRKHTVTHHSIHIRVLQIKAQAPQGIGRWWPLEKALAGPISGLSRKILIPLKEC
jgi:adenine-specific DNA glycosylase